MRSSVLASRVATAGFAVGLGLAVASHPGVAMADSDTSAASSTDASASSTADSHSPASGSAADTADTTDAGSTPDAEADDTSVDSESPSAAAESDLTDEAGESDGDTPNAPSVKAPSHSGKGSDGTPASTQSLTKKVVSATTEDTDADATTDAESAAAKASDSSGESSASQIATTATMLRASAEEPADSSTEIAVQSRSAPSAVTTLLQLPRTIVTTVVGMLNALLATTPGGDPNTTGLTGALQLLRRELEFVLFGTKPTASPSQIVAEEIGDRTVFGTLDAPGTNLSYEVTEQPAHGTVTVDSTGAWVYNPDDDAPAGSAIDSFNVTITDNDFNLPQLFGAPAPHTVITVPVRLAAKSSANQLLNFVDVYNLSSHPLTVVYNSPFDTSIDAPIEGTKINPGEFAHFEFDPQRSNQLTADFKDDVGNLYAVTMFFSGPIFGTDPFTFAKCYASKTSCSPTFFDNTALVLLMDKPGTTVNLDGAAGQDVSVILQGLCDNRMASCKFKPKSRVNIDSAEHLPTGFVPVRNDSTSPATTSISIADAVATATSWNVSVKVGAKILDIVTTEVSTTYGQIVTATHTFTQTIGMTVQPGETGYIYFTAPLTRYTGDFVVKTANTTFNLTNVTFDAPNATGNGKARVVTRKESQAVAE